MEPESEEDQEENKIQVINLPDGSTYENDTGFEVVDSVARKYYRPRRAEIIYPFLGMVPGRMFYFFGTRKKANQVYASGKSFGKKNGLCFSVCKIDIVRKKSKSIEEFSRYGCWCEKKE